MPWVGWPRWGPNQGGGGPTQDWHGVFSLSLQAGLRAFLSELNPSVHLPLLTLLAQPGCMTFPTTLKSLIWSLGFLLLSLGFFDLLGLTNTELCVTWDLGCCGVR